MSSRVLAGVLAAGCLTAAAGGAYLAVRQNVIQPAPVAASPGPAPPPTSSAVTPVTETEAVVSGAAKPKAEAEPVVTGKSAPAEPVAARPAAATTSKDTPKVESSPRRDPAPTAPKPRNTNLPAPQTSGVQATAERPGAA